VPGRIMLDQHSLQSLSIHLDNLQRTIERRIQQLEDAVEQSVDASRHRASNAMQSADAEIARVRRILSDIDTFEEESAKIKRIRDKMRQLRNSVDAADERLDRSRASGHMSGARPRR